MNKTTTCYFTLLSLFFFSLSFYKTNAQNNSDESAHTGFRMHGVVKMGDGYNKAKRALTKLIPHEQIVSETTFFLGDTLQGYDYTSTLNNALPKFKIYTELKAYMYRNEKAFVKRKYHIAELPIEKISHARLIKPANILSSACSNVDFENGNFTGWTGYVGYNANSAGSLSVTSTGISTAGTNASIYKCGAYHTLVTAAATNDPYGAFSPLDAGGGSYAVRLGGEDVNQNDGGDCTVNNFCTSGDQSGNSTGSGGEILAQTFTVTAGNTLFSFNYAAVLCDGGHSPGEQPYFTIEVLDHTGAPISCLSQHVELQSGVVPPGGYDAGFTDDCDEGELYVIPWQGSSINLAAYVGQTITVQFTAAGCIYGAHFGYAYFDAACGTSYQIISSTNSPCLGSNVVLTVPNQPGQTYTWAGPGIVSSSSNTATVNASGTYTVTVGSGSCSFTATTSVTFVTPTLTVSPTYTTCVKSPVTFSVSGASTYTWTPTTNLSGINSATPTVTPTSTTTTVYSVKGTSGSCTSAAKTVTLTVNPLPTVTVTPTSTAICSGAGSSTITASGTSTSYSWLPASTLNTSTGATVIATPTNIAAATVYTVTGINGNNCANTNTVSIQVNQTPTVTVSGGSSNTQKVCSGAAVAAITFSVSPASASVSWTNNNTAIGLAASGSGNIAGYTSPTVTATTTGLIVATATATSGSCPSTSATDLNYTITVNPLPGVNTPTITPAGCGLSNGSITGAAGVYGPGPYTYEWNNAGGFVASSSYTAAAGTYPLQIKDGTTGCVFTQNFTLPNAGAPTSPPITPGAQSACVGSNVVFSISTPVAGYTYSWTPATGTPGTGTSFTVSNVPASPNPYFVNVTATSTANCTGTSATATITVLALPSPAISNSTGGQFCQGGSTSLTVTPTGGYNYQWATGGATIVGATNNTLTVNAAGVYTVTVTNTVTTCSASTSTNGTITITPPPVVPVISNGINNPLTECQGVTPASFSLTTNANITPIWHLGSSIVATGQTYAPPTGTPTTNIYSVSDSSIVSGCTNTLAGNALTVTVTINPAPGTPTLSATVPNPLIECQGVTPATLTLTTNANISPVWYVGTSTVTTGQTYTPLTGTAGTTYYDVRDSSTVTHCTSAATGNVLTVTVTINPAPGTPTLTGSVPNPLIECQGVIPATLSLTTTASVSPVWYVGTNTVNIGQSITPSTATPTTTIYMVRDSSTVTHCNSAATGNVLTVTVTINPIPTLTISPQNSFTICNGGSQTFTVAGTGITSYIWTPSATLTGANTANPTASPTTTTNYTVIATNGNGCNNVNGHDTVTVNVTAPPTLTVTAGSYTICNGTSQTFTASGVGSYTWTPATNLSGANTASPTANPTVTTTYTVTGTTSGCISSPPKTVTLTVNPLLPTPILTGSVPNPLIECQGITPATLSLTTTASITPVWYMGTNTVTTGQSYTPSTTSPGQTIYTVIDSSIVTGCTSATSGNILTVTVTISPGPPTPTLSPSIPNPLVECQGTSNTLTITPAGTASITTIWYNSTGVVAHGQTYTPVSSTPGTIVYTVSDSMNVTGGCTNIQEGTALTVTVTISPALATPTLSASIPNPLLECQGITPATLTITPAGTASITTGWYTNTGLVGKGQTYAPSTSTPGTLIYTVSDSINVPGGCTNLNAGTALTVTVTINQAPTINVSTAQTSTATCGGINGGITGLVPGDVTGGTKPYHYQWYNGSTPILNDTNLLLNGVGQGTYSLLVTDAHNCTAFVTGAAGTTTTTFTVPALLAPTASFSTNPSSATGTAPLNIIFTNESVNATTYSWTFGDGNTSTLTDPTNTYTSTGTYIAVLTASATGCLNTSTVSITITVDVPTTIVIPNIFSPNGDGINDQFFIPNTGMSSLNCDIFNRWGELLFTITAPDQSWDGRIPNGDKAPDGEYMYILQAQGLNDKAFKQQGTITLIR